MPKVHPGGVLVDDLGAQVLRHQVRAILLTWHLIERDRLAGAGFLQPKHIHVDMSNFGQPLALNDPLRGRGVKVKLDLDLRPS